MTFPPSEKRVPEHGWRSEGVKTFVVNLDKSIARLERITRQLAELGMPFERIQAVYGATLSEFERKRDFAKFQSLIVMRRKLLDGEIGCSLSHDKIYRRMETEGIDIALVLEDDVLVYPCMNETLSKIEKFANTTKPQVFILSCYDKDESNNAGIERIHNATCTDGYVITLPAARAILRSNYPVVTTADSWPRWERKLGLQVYQYMPASVRQFCLGEFRSEIQSGKTNGERTLLGVARNVAKKLKRHLCRLKI